MLHYLAVPFALGAGILDARAGRIPNWLTLPAIPFALFGALISGGGASVRSSLVGLALCGGILAVPFFLTKGRGMGGGDVKCWLTLGAMLGPGLGLTALLYSLTTLLLFALFRETYRGRLCQVLRSTSRVLLRRGAGNEEALTTMRFGPAIFVGTFAAVISELPLSFLEAPK